jgi:hypothetical protein
VAEAINRADALGAALPVADDQALAAAFEAVPVPALLVGPPPGLAVVYANGAAREQRGSPAIGVPVPEIVRPDLERAFAGRSAIRLERPSWTTGAIAVDCVAVPLGDGAGRPLIALYDLDDGGAQQQREAAAVLTGRLERAERTVRERDAALALAGATSERLRALTGVQAIVSSLELLVGELGAADGAIAPYMSGQVVVGRSLRGMLGPDMLTVAAQPPLADALRTGTVVSAAAQDIGDLDLPGGAAVVIAPAICAGEPLGVVLLVFDTEPALGEAIREALAVAGTALGLALMQERLLTGEPGAGR